MDLWGHRGSRLPGPENTPEAVAGAIGAGADGCEVDVRRSADGVLVCHHDPHFGTRAVIEATAVELVAAGVPLLADVIPAARDRRLVIEVKNAPDEPDFSPDAVSAQLLVQLLAQRSDTAADVLISSFDPASLDVAQAAGWPVALLTGPGVSVADGLAYASAAGYQELHAHVSAFERLPAPVAAGLGLRLVAWTVTCVDEVFALQSRGVDAVICDDPASVARALDESRGATAGWRLDAPPDATR